jgi:uncharacterized protein
MPAAMMKKTWADFYARLEEIDFGKHDLIVAIGQGGIIPAAFIQQKLKIPMRIITLNYRDEENVPRYKEVRLEEKKKNTIFGKRILLVDDVARSGKTLKKARAYLTGNRIKTCVINGEADYSFYNETECIKMPWKR